MHALKDRCLFYSFVGEVPVPPILGTKLPFFNLRNKEQEHKKLSLLGANLHWYRCSLYAKTLAKVISSYNVCSFLSFLIKRDLVKIFDTAVFITSDHIIKQSHSKTYTKHFRKK